MRLDDLTKPISPDAPCGEDLLEAGDGDFLAYYYDAEARMPERYVSLATGETFDAKSVDLKAELKTIEGLLKRTVDLRLIALDARFNILAGRIKGFCEALIGMANVLEAAWEDVHPQIIDGEFFERQNAIEFLDTRATVVAPLEHAPIIIDRRAGEVTLRGYMVASGQSEARAEEAVGDASAMLTALGSSENAQDIDALHGLLSQARDACDRIVKAAADNGAPFVPALGKLKEKLDQVLGLIQQTRSDLAGDGGDAGTAGADSAPAAAPGDAMAAAAPASSAPVAVGSVKSHADVRAALAGAESYFKTFEPSSPALILVNQARLLVGRPLVEALETLLPDFAGQAVIELGSDTGFSIRMGRMKELSGGAMKGTADKAEKVEPRTVENRDQAMAEIKAVEAFYQAFEPASPIPVLMFKARSFLNRDFQSIVRDLIPEDAVPQAPAPASSSAPGNRPAPIPADELPEVELDEDTPGMFDNISID